LSCDFYIKGELDLKTKINKLCLSFVTAFAVLSAPAMALAQEGNQKMDYLALGDSLAAGQTPYKEISKGYTDYLANQLSKVGMLASFDKRYSVSGYTTTDILHDIQTNIEKPDSTGKTVAIQTAIKNAEIITIDAGANDALREIVINRETGAITADPEKVKAALTTVGQNTDLILKEIRSLNPNADIYVMGYYNPLPSLPSQYQTLLNILLSQLNSTISSTSEPFNVTFVPTAAPIAVNATTYLPNGEDIHPNQAGYLVLANEFWKAINVGKSVELNDTLPEVAKEEIHYLVEKGIIAGFEDGSFRPNNLITRVQSAIMLDRAIVYSDDAAANPGYADVTTNSFGYDVIAKMTEQGVFSGANGYFNPDQSLTRAQMAKVLVEAFGLTGSSTQTFNDVSSDYWASNYISILAENKITTGYTDGTFKPNDSITRAEFSIMLARALGK
jgi:lysophospholipase L1-like esterase